MPEKLIISENDAIWFMKHKDQVSIYENINDDNATEHKLSKQDVIKIIKFLIDTI